MKKGLFAVLAAGLFVGSVSAAEIGLQNAADGSAKLTLDGFTGEYGYLNLVIKTYDADTPGSLDVSFVNAFLDATNDNADVGSVAGGQNWTYDRTAFKLPAELDEAGGNEYGLVSGDSDGGDALPLGSATHVIDTLGLYTSETSGNTLVTFELGARQPQVFGKPPTYIPFTVAPFGFPPNFPGFLYIGSPTSTNPGFEINYVPEPAALGLLALGGLVAFRRR
jgi:hypothetical protein